MNGPERQTCAVAPGGPLRPWLELVRAPNLLTALADAAAGFLFTHPALARQDLPWFALLATASVLLYAGGVVLNDVFDCRPTAESGCSAPCRPAGSRRAAERLGWSLLAGGLAGLGRRRRDAELRPALVATGLAAMIVAYDRVVKRTPLGPVAMGGACRSPNLLLGDEHRGRAVGSAEHALIAVAIGLYVTGVTWFARTEASSSRQGAGS